MIAIRHKRKRRGFAIAVIGCGNIGSFACLLAARLPGLTELVLVDLDASYTAENLPGQNIVAADARSGLPKVEVMRRMVARVRRGLRVVAFCCPVAQVPLGWLRVDVILVCVDSKASRMQVNQIAWRLGVPLLDAGVHADGHLVRVSIVAPGPGQPCLECSWDDGDYAALEQRLPCAGSRPAAPATHAPACLGSLAGSLQVALCALLLADQPGTARAGRQLVLDVSSLRFYDTTLRRNERCRFDHQRWRVQPLAASPSQLSLHDAMRLGNGGRPRAGTGVLRTEPGYIVRTLVCRCGRRRDVLHVSGRAGGRAMRCPHCGRLMLPLNLGASSRLHADELTPRELRLPLSRLGFQPGDIFGVGSGRAETHYQLPME